jgi:hypothetical protein
MGGSRPGSRCEEPLMAEIRRGRYGAETDGEFVALLIDPR